MDDGLIREIKIFCKRQQTLGHKIYALLHEFKEKRKVPDIILENFEDALLQINARVAVDLQDQCYKFIKLNGADSYLKFTREHEYVSANFWSKAVEKAEGIKEGIKPKQDVITPDDRYHSLLPMDWTMMSFSDKVSFVSRVQHKGFFNYILDSDKKLKEYFSKIKHTAPNGLKLYVTIFSIQADSYSEESKNLLRTFVETLNMVGRAKLQYIKCSDPDVIEIREVR